MPPNRMLALTLPLLLSACSDPMTATDGIMPVAGLAQDHNAAIHIINPNAGHGGGNPGGSGQRAAVVIDRYNTGETEAGAAEGG